MDLSTVNFINAYEKLIADMRSIDGSLFDSCENYGIKLTKKQIDLFKEHIYKKLKEEKN